MREVNEKWLQMLDDEELDSLRMLLAESDIAIKVVRED